MKDQRLLPSYNAIITTEGQLITNYTIHQNPGEKQYLIDHLQSLEQRIGRLPESVVGDAAYGTEENYQYLEDRAIGNYLKYGNFYRESKGKHSLYFEKEDFAYNPVGDYYICPNLRKLRYKTTIKETSRHGYKSEVKQYECQDCQDCPLSQMCRKGKSNRRLNINENLERLQNQARRNLTSEQGLELRKKRGIDVEPVFGDIKQNFGYRRFRLRGIYKVRAEFGVVSLAHNIKKMHSMKAKAAQMEVKMKNPEQFFVFLRLLELFLVISALKYNSCKYYRMKINKRLT